MPAALTYPGVYIEELQSGVHTITGVATSITAFIGSAPRGQTNEPIRVQSFAEFERELGGLWAQSTLGYAVAQFFLNGGGDALIVRVASAGATARANIGGLPLIAAQSGQQGNGIVATIGNATSGTANLFKLTVKAGANPAVVFDEQSNLTIGAALAAAAVRLDPAGPALNARPANGGPTNLAGGKDGAAAASGALGTFTLAAASVGKWGQALRFRVDDVGSGKFNLSLRDSGTGVTEKFLNLSPDPNDPRFVTTVLEQQSKLVRIQGAAPNPLTVFSNAPTVGVDPLLDDTTLTKLTGSATDDGSAIADNDISLPSLAGTKHGLWALEKADLFNLLCIPPLTFDTDINAATRTAAALYCKQRRAMFLVDPLMAWNSVASVIGNSAATGLDGTDFGMARSENAALFFPFIVSPDPLQENRLETFAPCGAVAGVMARTDASRGVWKAPAGLEATVAGASALAVKLTDGENGRLNPIGVNCLRSFPVTGRVVWGARTMRGADQLADQWKYIPVRRLALYIEESLFRGTQWVVFEPNDEPLWSQIRLNVGGFMNTLFRQGAFQGATPKDAYFVKCSRETTTQTDIDNGVVNIIVGFAPLKPAEFVVIKIQQIAGQTES
ncbi:phage tail sheath family protein [uncultured Bradyrhizobium sp.]|uniref:phage tail sheath family protein n=1 Tax=uncultured Bradyrhizobium sp. TaxID=199684 RepID=UPI0035CC253B